MARKKEFDPDVALEAAMTLFWEKGYEATTVSDLVRRLGIGRSSFYDTFGGKHELYLRALDLYMTEGAGSTLFKILARPGRAIDAVRELIDWYLRLPEPGMPRGCLIVNTAVELGGDDQASADRLEANRQEREQALIDTLRRAQAEHDLPADADPVALARFLLVVLNGILVLQRGGAEPRVVIDAGRVALDAPDITSPLVRGPGLNPRPSYRFR